MASGEVGESLGLKGLTHTAIGGKSPARDNQQHLHRLRAFGSPGESAHFPTNAVLKNPTSSSPSFGCSGSFGSEYDPI